MLESYTALLSHERWAIYALETAAFCTSMLAELPALLPPALVPALLVRALVAVLERRDEALPAESNRRDMRLLESKNIDARELRRILRVFCVTALSAAIHMCIDSSERA